jgi:ABC-type phosphate transport system substrate-binding protein
VKIRELTKCLLWNVLLASFFVSMLSLALEPNAQLHVVTSPSINIKQISTRELRAIFTMKRQRWADSTPVTVVVLSAQAPLHQRFCKEILKLFPHQLQTSWDRLVYSGRGSGPVVVSSEQEMLDMLATTPGAIGYLQDEQSAAVLNILEIEK